jgi:ribosomal-protein-alanine N-acetyltransferase
MSPILTTKRLAFYPFSQGDLAALTELHADLEVMRYLSPDGQLWTPEVLQSKLNGFVAEHARRGHSKWKVCLHDGTFIGRAGFSVFPSTNELELGIILKRAYWGKGYATECGRGLIDWVFWETPAQCVIAFAHVDNLASRRVLEKLGMEDRETREVNGIPSAFYILCRASPGARPEPQYSRER